MSQSSQPALGNGPQGANGPPAQPGGAIVAALPPIWVAINVVLAAWGIMDGWRSAFDYDIPDGALYLVHGGLVAAVVNILWGLFLVGLAVARSASFPRHFTIWQVANIVWIVLREIYVLLTPVFVQTIQPLLYAAGEIAVGIACILLLRRKSATIEVYSNAGTQRPPAIVSVIAALLGIVVGGALGFGAGLLGGSLIAELTDISCFEGGCGYFALFIGLFAMLAGAVAGGILAVWWSNRVRPPRPA